MSTENIDKVINLVEKLGAIASDTGKHAFAILTKKFYTDALVDVVFYSISIVSILVIVLMLFKKLNKAVESDESFEHGSFGMRLIVIVVSSLLLLFSIIDLVNSIQIVIFPEGAALKSLLGTLR